MFGKKDEYKNILLFKKGNALVSVSSGWPYKWALRKKRPGHMLYCYKDYGRQRRRRVVNTDCFGNSSKSQGSETFVAEKNYKLAIYFVQGSNTGKRKTGLQSNISRYSAS